MLSRRVAVRIGLVFLLALALANLIWPAPPAQAACPAGTVSTSLASGTFGVVAVCLPVSAVSPGRAPTGSSGFAPLAVLYCVTTPTGIQAVHAGKEAEISSISDFLRRVACPVAAPSGPTADEIEDAARRAAASIKLPPVEARYGPAAELNEWGLVPVGYPIWLWTPARADIQTSVTKSGIRITILATRVRTSFAMGNGKTLNCPLTTPWTSDVAPGDRSPTCGYAYPAMNRKPSAGFIVTATDHWSIAWTALGESGTVSATRSQKFHLPVGELQSLIVAD